MLFKRISRALRAWLYRKVCNAEQQKILSLLDRVVQESQGVLLQLQTACEMIETSSPAKKNVDAALKLAEGLLEQWRDQVDVHRPWSRTYHRDQ
jgi:hypothetical protein